ncbi:galactitol-1-phosphate 5-dehydrogenase [Enterococcus sp. 669A]|uniref:Galactitol-1-phosphate 5-dehydrogenase n=1 Tax=Candidatus Enterococcus moelleringii TaxID=2815325 RepID=A0ABS3LF51_9ENTE|nr:galactitol-1-phosphate 5-dehydrogenase [Enterococcus sp. 669A]MBO1307653.1 galactitol-1-phosphate 5-dehydrogenase [Enterococcus sp. 669A]
MKAVRMYAVKDLRVEDVPKPEPKNDEVLLKIHAVGVCGSDIPRALIKGPHVLPITLGHEFAGEIIELGSDVKEWQVGDRVAVAPLIPDYEDPWSKKGIYSLSEGYKYYGSRNDGAFAEYLAVKALNLIKLADNVPYDWGATIDPAANAVHACLRAELTSEDSVAVYGMGAIGLFAVQYAKAKGVKNIFAIDIDDRKLEIAKQSGATTTINSKNADAVKTILEATDNQGVNVSLEMSGTEICQVQAVQAASKMGRVVYLGISNASLTFPKETVDKILRYQVNVMGSWNSFSDPFPGIEWTESAELMAKGLMNPEIFITQRLGLDDVPDIFKQLDKKELYFIKIMFYPND